MLVRPLTEIITKSSCTSCTNMVSEGTLCLGLKLSDWALSNSCIGGRMLIRKSEISVNSGVLQGSVPCPLLFLLYTNDLPENIHLQVRLFADDIAVYLTVNNTVQQDLETLQTWGRLWDMDFNPSKNQAIHITKSRHPALHIYTFHGQALEAAGHVKYIGVDISKDLSWNAHINRISANANRTLGFLKRNIKTKPTGIRQQHTLIKTSARR